MWFKLARDLHYEADAKIWLNNIQRANSNLEKWAEMKNANPRVTGKIGAIYTESHREMA